VWAKPAPRVRIPLSPPLAFTMKNIQYKIKQTQELIKSFDKIVVFSGAGISVASGIPTFRGPDGLWSRYNPIVLDIDFFKSNPKESWRVIKEIFYDFMQNIKPNAAHYAIAKLECPVITQNIDNLHQEAGSNNVVEFHGNAKTLICTNCSKRYRSDNIDLSNLPPRCENCDGILKPDFVFFKEPIPENAYRQSIILAQNTSLMIIVGTTGEIMPASQMPYIAKERCKNH
jgi:NAD-dependent deacetylase